VSASFYTAAVTSGITVFKPFGGMCAGLEMALRNGFKVERYIYADTNSAARAVAAHCVRQLDLLYPGQLALNSCVDMFVTLDQPGTALDADLSPEHGGAASRATGQRHPQARPQPADGPTH
jgi:hypothetical protein